METSEVEHAFGKYYQNKIVTAVIGVETDVNKVEAVAKGIIGHNSVEDAFIVTGEYDIILKVRFPEFWALQEFLVDELSKIPGVRSIKTMMVLTTVKDKGKTLMES
ncbi:MAG: Lrp/AsnC ligand binding domain-containing protein [Thermoplasmataceae archaeon]